MGTTTAPARCTGVEGPSVFVRRYRVPQALHSIGLDAGPRRHCGESARWVPGERGDAEGVSSAYILETEEKHIDARIGSVAEAPGTSRSFPRARSRTSLARKRDSRSRCARKKRKASVAERTGSAAVVARSPRLNVRRLMLRMRSTLRLHVLNQRLVVRARAAQRLQHVVVAGVVRLAQDPLLEFPQLRVGRAGPVFVQADERVPLLGGGRVPDVRIILPDGRFRGDALGGRHDRHVRRLRGEADHLVRVFSAKARVRKSDGSSRAGGA